MLYKVYCKFLLVLICAVIATSTPKGLRARRADISVPTFSAEASISPSISSTGSSSVSTRASETTTSSASHSTSASVLVTPTAPPNSGGVSVQALAECLTLRLRVRVLAGGVLRDGARTFLTDEELLPAAAQGISSKSAGAWNHLDVASAWAGNTQPFLESGLQSNDVLETASFFLAAHEPIAASIELWAACKGWAGRWSGGSASGGGSGGGGDVALGMPLPGPSWLLPFAGNWGNGLDGCGFVVSANTTLGAAAVGYPARAARESGASQSSQSNDNVIIPASVLSPISLFPQNALRAGWAYRITPLHTSQMTLHLATAAECLASGISNLSSSSSVGTSPRLSAPLPNLVADSFGAVAGNILARVTAISVGGPLVYIRAPPSNGLVSHNITSSISSPFTFTITVNSSGWTNGNGLLLTSILPTATASAALFSTFAFILPPKTASVLSSLASSVTSNINPSALISTAITASTVAATLGGECDDITTNAIWAKSLIQATKLLLWSNIASVSQRRTCASLSLTISASLTSASQIPITNTNSAALPRLYLRADVKNRTGAWLPRGGIFPWASPVAVAMVQRGTLGSADIWPGFALTPACTNLPCITTFRLTCGDIATIGCNASIIAFIVDDSGSVGAAASTLVNIEGIGNSTSSAFTALQILSSTTSIASCPTWEPLEACIARISSVAAIWSILAGGVIINDSQRLSVSNVVILNTARGVILTGLRDTLNTLFVRESFSLSSASAAGVPFDSSSLSEVITAIAVLSSGPTKDSPARSSSGITTTVMNAAHRLAAAGAIQIAARLALPSLTLIDTHLPPLLLTSLPVLPSHISTAFASAIAGLLVEEASDATTNGTPAAWGGSESISAAMRTVIEAVGRSLSAVLLRSGNIQGVAAGAPFFLPIQSTCATRGLLIIVAVRVSAGAGVSIDSAAALPTTCDLHAEDGGAARVRLSAGAPDGTIATLLQWGTIGPVASSATGPTGVVELPVSSSSSVRRALLSNPASAITNRDSSSFPLCQSSISARSVFGFPPLPTASSDAIPSRNLDTPLISLWLSTSTGTPLSSPVSVSISFSLDISDMGISAAASAATLSASSINTPLSISVLSAASTSISVQGAPSLTSALAFTPPTLSLRCPSFRSDNVTFITGTVINPGTKTNFTTGANINISLIAWSNSSANGILATQITALTSSLASSAPWAASIATVISDALSPLWTARIPISLSLAPVLSTTFARLSVPC
jgi:hypothetical protein